MRFSSVLAILILLFLSCNQRKEEIPNILNREQMVNILTDIQILEAKLNFEKKTVGEFERTTKKHYEAIFSKYNIRKEQFEESLFYYEQNIEELDNIYSDVIIKLNKIQSEVNRDIESSEDYE